MAYIQRSDSGRFQFAVSSNGKDTDEAAAAAPVADAAHNPLHNRTSSGDSSQNPEYAVHDADKRGCRRPGCQQPGERFVGATVLVCGTVALAAAGGGYYAPTYLDEQLQSGLSMCNSDDSAFEGWEATISLEEDGTSAHLDTIPQYKLYYFWDITNKEDFLNGADPIMQEKGPYAIQERTTKVDVSFDEDAGTVTYKDWTYADYDPFLSCEDCSLDDTVTNFNPVWLTALSAAGQESLAMLGSVIPSTFAANMAYSGQLACTGVVTSDEDFVTYSTSTSTCSADTTFLPGLDASGAGALNAATCKGLDSTEEASVFLTHAGTISATSPTVTQAGTDIGTDRYTSAYGYAATVSGCVDLTTGAPQDCTGTDFNTYCGAFGGAGAESDACQAYVTGEALFAGSAASGTGSPCEAVGLGTQAGLPACNGLPVPCTDAADACYTDHFAPHAEFYNACVAGASTSNTCTTLIGDSHLASVVAAGDDPAADPTYLYIAAFQQSVDAIVGIYADNDYTISQEDLLDSLTCLGEWYQTYELGFHLNRLQAGVAAADPASCSQDPDTGAYGAECLILTTRSVGDLAFGHYSPLYKALNFCTDDCDAAYIPGYQTSYDNKAAALADPLNKYNTQSTGCGAAEAGSEWTFTNYQDAEERCFSPLSEMAGDDTVACEAVKGTDGAGYEPLGVSAWERFDITQGWGWTKDTPHDSLEVYVSQAKRSLKIDYVEDVEVQGVSLAKYAPSDELLVADTTGEDTSRSQSIGVGVPVDGVQSIQPFMDFKVYVSHPHFLYGDESLQLEGLSADADLHSTYIAVEPATGKTMDFHNRLQASFALNAAGETMSFIVDGTEEKEGRTYTSPSDPSVASSDVTAASMVPGVIVPQYWADHTATIDEDTASSLKQYQMIHSSATLAVYAGAGAGVVLLCLGTVLLVKASKHRREAARNAELAAAAEAANMGEGRV